MKTILNALFMMGLLTTTNVYSKSTPIPTLTPIPTRILIPTPCPEPLKSGTMMAMPSIDASGCPEEPPIPPPPPTEITPTTYTITTSTYDLSVYLGVGDVLDKPVILVEGLDASNEFYGPDIYNLLNTDFRKWLWDSKRDFVVLNFRNAKQDIKVLGGIFEDALNNIQSRQTGSHPTAVIGFSMGGLVTRWQLKQMENRGVDHNVSVYISYDAPHRGASVPQSIIDGLNDLKDKLPHVPNALRKSIAKVQSYASKQMIIGLQYSSFLKELEDLGYPNNLARFAVANGSGGGVRNNLGFNSVVYDYKVEIFQVSTEYQTLKQEPYHPCTYPCDFVRAHNYDNSPGGQTDGFKQYWLGLEDGDSGPIFDLDVYFKDQTQEDFTLVNTLSALDIKNYDIDTEIDGFMERYGPFDGYAYDDENKDHLSIHFANDGTEKINQWLGSYHKSSASIPYRGNKLDSIGTVTGFRTQWLYGGTNDLSWNSVPGATHYEILQKRVGTPVYDVIATELHTRHILNVNTTISVAVRACNADQCGYSDLATARWQPDVNPW